MTGFERGRSDSSLGVQTPEGIEFVLYPAGLLARGCAWIIDVLIQWVLLAGLFIAFGALRGAMGVWLLLILRFLLNWFYHTAFEVFCRGQSPGKRALGLRVVRSDGSPVNPGASFMRNLLRFADAFMMLYLIVFVCILASPAFRRIGDWVADTLVVYSRAGAPSRLAPMVPMQSGMAWLADIPLAEPSRRLEYEEKQAVLAFARRYPLLGKARADEICAAWAAKLRSAAGIGGMASASIGAAVSGGAVSIGAASSGAASVGAAGIGADSQGSRAEASPSDYLLGIARSLGG